ncbi:MAG: EamA family transporter [Betaproteobacteria bacterium]|nr:EamA family transporter [Betaproteobacteria bacterium]
MILRATNAAGFKRGTSLLGATLALLSAASFALNTVTARRGVVTGTPSQAMAVSVPLGVVCFALAATVMGDIGRLRSFPPAAMAWMAGVGVVHFVVGRYCNYRATKAAGANLVSTVLHLQVVATLTLAVVVLHEPCTVLQMIGGAMIIAGSIITHQQRVHPAPSGADAGDVFVPHRLAGYCFATLAALAYGTSPIMARIALADSAPGQGLLGGLIAYIAATAVVSLALLWRTSRQNILALNHENGRWFFYSGLFVAIAQGLFFAAVSIAPIMFVMPLLQMSLVFLLILSRWFNPHHEVFGRVVILGVATSIAGALSVSISTESILGTLTIPDPLAGVLRWRL